MEFRSAYNFSLSYRRGNDNDNDNADFLFRPPLPLTEEGISGSYDVTIDDVFTLPI